MVYKLNNVYLKCGNFNSAIQMQIQIRILRTQAFNLLALLTGHTPDTLERYVLNRMTAEEMLDTEEKTAAGKTILEEAEQWGFGDAEQITAILFPGNLNPEVRELLGGVYFWGAENEDPCQHCGSLMEYHESDWSDEHQHPLDIYRCANEDCMEKDYRKGEQDEMTYLSSM